MKGGAICFTLAIAAVATVWFSGPSVFSVVLTSPGESGRRMGDDIVTLNTVRGIGYVEPISEVRRLTFKTDGVVAECPVVLGQNVKEGDVLMVLRNRDTQAAVLVFEEKLAVARAEKARLLSGSHPALIAAAEHRVEEIRGRMKYEERQRDRIAKLRETNVSTQDEFENAESDLEQTRNSLSEAIELLRHLKDVVRPEEHNVEEGKVRLAEAELCMAKEQLANTILTAPCDGTVLEILKREGEAVRAFDGEPAILFADLRVLRIRGEIDERFVSYLKTGQSVRIHSRTLGECEYHGRIASLKRIMGKKTVFSRESSERKDLEVIQMFVEVPGGIDAPIGLEVDIEVQITGVPQ